MTLLKWQPFDNMIRMQENINKVFKNHYDELNKQGEGCQTCWAPAADIYETDKEYLFKLEVPGLAKELIQIEFNDNIISVKGEKKQDTPLDLNNFHRLESTQGKFCRSFTLPQHVDGEKIAGSLRDGILEIHIPKSEKAQKKTIQINVN